MWQGSNLFFNLFKHKNIEVTRFKFRNKWWKIRKVWILSLFTLDLVIFKICFNIFLLQALSPYRLLAKTHAFLKGKWQRVSIPWTLPRWIDVTCVWLQILKKTARVGKCGSTRIWKHFWKSFFYNLKMKIFIKLSIMLLLLLFHRSPFSYCGIVMSTEIKIRKI